MKKLLLGSFLIVIALFVNCTSGGDDVSVFGDIYGTITDSKSGEPVRNAEVILSPGNKSTVSGSNGHFEFKTLEAGQYKVGVEADGYEYNSRQITVVPGQNTVCDFRLVEIFVEQVLKVTPTTLNFGTSQNEMSVTITNEGTEETEWSVNLGNNNWLSANPKTGRIAAGKSQTIVFAVNRDLVAEDKSAVVNIAAFGNTYPISVSCTPKKTKGELAVEPTSLSFDEELSELEIKIKNTGDGELNWTISGISANCLSVSDASGKIVAGGNKVVKVKLDRDKLEKDLTTTFTVSDGDKDISVAVTAKKKILKGELVVEPTSLNFGEDLSEQTITIKNVGDASLKWTISKVTSPLSVSEKEGELAAGGSKVVKVLLDRNNMSEDVNSSFVVSDGEHEKKISVAAKKIVYAPKLEVSTIELNFGLTATELFFNINNTGNADLKWSIPTPVSSCISVASSQGTITPGSSHKVVVKLDRSTMPETLNTTLTVTDGANDVQVNVKAEKGHPHLGLTTNKLDFGTTETVMTFDVVNQGDATANLRWEIDEAYHNWLTVSPTSGELPPNYYTTVTVTLNRSVMTSDLETEIALFDLDDDVYYYPITVLATKGSAASSVAVPQGLYTYYMFEDNFEDSTENEIHGYGNNSPTFVTGVTSDSKAVKLSRTKNSSFIVPEGLFDTRDKTISFWGKDFDDGVIFYVVSENNNNAMFSLSMSNGVLKFVGSRYMNSYQYNNTPSFSHPTINDGKWHHIVLTSDFNKTSYALTTTTLYVDGMKVDTITEDGNPFTEAERENASYDTGVKFVMGGSLTLYSGTTLNGTNMSIDNLRIYDTRRLSADEVKAIYKSKE
ncbi:MAG: carboxypeptidase regulatory-like domain-containing protein [Alistipes sp.]|nr:carboxypeptidase regulatory-like domain-containing protein [Alistipes sp.]